MVKSNFTTRYKSRFANCREISEREVGRPRLLGLRLNPIVSGTLEYLVQPLYDFYAVAANTAVTKQGLFAQPIGASYTPAGGAAVTKTLYHTNLVQPGMLDAPKKMLIKALALVIRSDVQYGDLNSFLGLTLCQLIISGKDYWTSLASKIPAGAGSFFLGAAATTAVTTSIISSSGSNGWPSAQNVASIVDDMPQIPGLPAMEPILGQLVEQQQNFTVTVDPTITGAAGFTTSNAVAPQIPGTGINAHCYLEGVLARAVL